MSSSLGPTDDQIIRMRTTVLTKITTSSSLPRMRTGTAAPARRRTRFIIAGIAAVVVVLLVSGVIPVGPRGASAEAAEVLRAAADATIVTSDPVVPDGQYLKVATSAAYLSGAESETGIPAAWIMPTTFDLYIPADPTQDGTQERHELQPTVFFGDGAEAVATKAYNDFKDRSEVNGIRHGRTAVLLNRPNTITEIEEMPRDPAALKRYIDAHAINSASAEEATWLYIIDLLRTGVVPADLRAALYEAAILVPGVAYVDGSSTLDGRTGVAIGRIEPSRDVRQDIIINPTTGMLIGERTVTLTDQGLIPAGTVTGWTSITTSVQATAP